MYGTIARLKTKPGAVEALRTLAEQADQPPGAVAEYVYQTDDDPNELWLVVMFESKEAYHANAQSPEQHARFEQMMQWLTEEPEWHDGEIVHAAHFEA